MSNKRRAKTRDWLNRQNRDPFVKQAREQGYRGRAVYKLREIDDKYRLIRPGRVVADLGAAPGSWSQYCAEKMKLNEGTARGTLIAIDILEMRPIEGVSFVQGDFTCADQLKEIDRRIGSKNEKPIDVVLSDMAPNISGIALQDQGRYERLLEAVLAFCQLRLKPGGALLSKFFEGQSAQSLRQAFKMEFSSVKSIKPEASRSGSREQYLLALGKK